MRPWYGFCLEILLLFVSCSVAATTLEVTPVQLSLHPTQIGVLKVTNRSDKATLLQLYLVRWQQRNGKDLYQASHDVLMTPPLFRLPAHKTQVVRFALRRPLFSNLQQTYRLHIKEIDSGKRNKLGQQLYFLIDLSLPLFIEPQRVNQQFIWSMKSLDSDHIQLKLYNDGNVTLFVKEWQLIDDQKNLMLAKKSTFTYLMPGQSHHWVVATNSKTEPTDIKSIINGQTKKSILHKL